MYKSRSQKSSLRKSSFFINAPRAHAHAPGLPVVSSAFFDDTAYREDGGICKLAQKLSRSVLAHLEAHDDDGLARLQRGRLDRAPPGFSLEPQLTRLFRREMTGRSSVSCQNNKRIRSGAFPIMPLSLFELVWV